MKKILFVLTLALTFTLTGCKTEEEKIEDVIHDFEELFFEVMSGEATNIDRECDRIFVEKDAIECKQEFDPEDESFEAPYLFELDMEVLSITEFNPDDYSWYVASIEDGYFDQYDKVFIVTLYVTQSLQATETAMLNEDEEEMDMFVVKINGSYKIDTTNTPSEVD